VEKNSVAMARRDRPGRNGKTFVSQDGLALTVSAALADIHTALHDRALVFRKANTYDPGDYDEFKQAVEKGWALSWWCGNDSCETRIKKDTRASTRCIPLEQPGGEDLQVLEVEPGAPLLGGLEALGEELQQGRQMRVGDAADPGLGGARGRRVERLAVGGERLRLVLAGVARDRTRRKSAVRIGDDRAALERAGREMLARARMQALLITRGSRGMALFEADRPTRHIPIFGSDEIADVTGAGDTVIAAMTLALAAGASFYEAARLANYAGGLVVMKRGTATVSARELADAVKRDPALEETP